MADCPVCKKPVIIDPRVLSDGQIVHASCRDWRVRRARGRQEAYSVLNVRAAPTRRKTS